MNRKKTRPCIASVHLHAVHADAHGGVRGRHERRRSVRLVYG